MVASLHSHWDMRLPPDHTPAWCDATDKINQSSYNNKYYYSYNYTSLLCTFLEHHGHWTGMNLHSLSKCSSHWLCRRSFMQPYCLLGHGTLLNLQDSMCSCRKRMHEFQHQLYSQLSEVMQQTYHVEFVLSLPGAILIGALDSSILQFNLCCFIVEAIIEWYFFSTPWTVNARLLAAKRINNNNIMIT